MDNENTFLFMTFDQLYDYFSWKIFFGDLRRKVVKFQLSKPYIDFKFPILVIGKNTEKYEQYVASQSENPKHSYYKTVYVTIPEKYEFQTTKLWQIYEKLTDQRFWQNYNFIKEFIKFHKLCWDEYHKNIPK